jgi:methionyl-tRNA synthetase
LLGEKGSIHDKTWDVAFDDLQIGFELERPQPLFKKLDIKDIIVNEEDPFSKVDLRVAKVIGVKDIPEADKLYMLNLDLGKLGKRVIVAGMKPYYTPEEITGKSIVVVVNLKPVKIRGVTSNGMLLAAEDGKGIVALLNPGDSIPGSEVVVKGVDKKPASVLDFEDFKKIKLVVDEFGKATYNKKVLCTEKTDVVSDKPVEKGARIL